MKLIINESDKALLLDRLKIANLQFQKTYPSDKLERQAAYTVYGGANLFKSDTTHKIGEAALNNLLGNAPNFAVLARVLKLDGYEYLPHTEEAIKA